MTQHEAEMLDSIIGSVIIVGITMLIILTIAGVW